MRKIEFRGAFVPSDFNTVRYVSGILQVEPDVIEPEDAADEREGEALRTEVHRLTTRVIDLECEHMDLERRLAASEAEVARLERLHREQMAARAAAGPNTGANQENEET